MPVAELDNEFLDEMFNSNHENDDILDAEEENREKEKMQKEEKEIFDEERYRDENIRNDEMKQENNTHSFKGFFNKIRNFFKKIIDAVVGFATVVVYGRKAISLVRKEEINDKKQNQEKEIKEDTKKEDIKEEKEVLSPDKIIRNKMIEESKEAPYFNFKLDHAGFESFLNATIVDGYVYSVKNERLSKEDYKEGKSPNLNITIKDKLTQKKCGELTINPNTFSIIKNNCHDIKDENFDVKNIESAYLSYQQKNNNPNLLIGSITPEKLKNYDEVTMDCATDIFKKLDAAMFMLKHNDVDAVNFDFKTQTFTVVPGKIDSNDKIQSCDVIVGGKKYPFSVMDLNMNVDGRLTFTDSACTAINAVNEFAEKNILQKIKDFDPNTEKDMTTSFNQYLENFIGKINEEFSELGYKITNSCHDNIVDLEFCDSDNQKMFASIAFGAESGPVVEGNTAFTQNILDDLYAQMQKELNRGIEENELKLDFIEKLNSLSDTTPDNVIFEHSNFEAHVNKIKNQYYISIYNKDTNEEILPTSKLGTVQLTDKIINRIAQKMYSLDMDNQYNEITKFVEKYANNIAEEKAELINTENSLSMADSKEEKEENVSENKTIDEIIEETNKENEVPLDEIDTEAMKYIDELDCFNDTSFEEI